MRARGTDKNKRREKAQKLLEYFDLAHLACMLRETSCLLETPIRETLKILWQESVKGNILVSTQLKALELARKTTKNTKK